MERIEKCSVNANSERMADLSSSYRQRLRCEWAGSGIGGNDTNRDNGAIGESLVSLRQRTSDSLIRQSGSARADEKKDLRRRQVLVGIRGTNARDSLPRPVPPSRVAPNSIAGIGHGIALRVVSTKTRNGRFSQRDQFATTRRDETQSTPIDINRHISRLVISISRR